MSGNSHGISEAEKVDSRIKLIMTFTLSFFFFFNDTATTVIYTLSLHDALPIYYIIDIREEFGNHVIDNFVDEYLAGRTPNPCVMCNTHIKWEALLRRANMLDCEFIEIGRAHV